MAKMIQNFDFGATYKVIDGPSREDLFDAQRLYAEGRKVSITLAEGGRINFQPEGIIPEAADGHTWLVYLFPMGGVRGELNLSTRYRTGQVKFYKI